MRKLRTILVPIAALSLVAAACGGDDDDASDDGDATEETDSGAAQLLFAQRVCPAAQRHLFERVLALDIAESDFVVGANGTRQ